MAHSALSALVALASLTLVAGQTTAAPNAAPTFPATPLVDQRFPYSAIVRISFAVNVAFFLLERF
jgi:hypothetical protein